MVFDLVARFVNDAHPYGVAIRAPLFLLLVAIPGLAAPEPLGDSARAQIQALQAEKASRTPAQQKMDSQLVQAAKLSRGESFAAGVPSLRPAVTVLPDGRVLVDVDADVTADVLQQIAAVGGAVVNQFPQFGAIRALLPVGQIEAIAALPDVRHVKRAVQAHTSVGSVTSQGDIAHGADKARATYRVDGSGIKVAVLSDSIDYLANSQALGDLGPVTVMPRQDGLGLGQTGEGTAMLEIIHDLAPGAALYFATAMHSPASYAQNILDLRAAGCDIIVDDVMYEDESPFQDGLIAQAVNTVTANGALYLSSASNEGSKDHGTSGTWEGDFKNGGSVDTKLFGKGGYCHDFGSNLTYDAVLGEGETNYYRVDLFWSDPLGQSTNDYDLFVLDPSGSNVVDSSTATQLPGTSCDPYESINYLDVGNRIVIVKCAGADRYLHLSTGRGRLAVNTPGSTRGHSAVTDAFSVAAVNASYSTNVFSGGTNRLVENFSSDGPRRMFYTTNGTALTPGNVSSTGGLVRQKPDIAAADCVQTSVLPYFGWFGGTSAAAPHAGAIAALLKSYNIALTPAQIHAALTNTALDIEAPGMDRDSGVGIVMAMGALQSVTGAPNPGLVGATLNDVVGGNGNGVVEPGETLSETLVWTNMGGLVATGLTAVLTTTTPGVTITQSGASLGSLAVAGAVSNASPYVYRVARTVPFGTIIGFTNVLTASGHAYTGVFSRSVGRLVIGSPVTNTFTANVMRTIPKAGTLLTTNVITLAGTNLADDVDVAVRIDYIYDWKLTIAVQNPDGTEVVLAQGIGGGADYGVGTPPGSVTNTTFDDQADDFIDDVTVMPPFAGSYRPQGLLSTFNGKPVNGPWKLIVTNSWQYDTGTNLSWSLRIVSHTNQYVGSVFDNPPVASNQSVAVVAGTTSNLVLRGSDADGDPIVFRTNSTPAHGSLSAFNSASGAIAYTAVSNYAGPDIFTFYVNDGLTNGAAATVSVTVAYLDSVGDGIPDWWRLRYFGVAASTNNRSCASADPDGDGMSNLREYLAGTDPTNSASVFKVVTLAVTGSSVRVGWKAGGGIRSVLQGATRGANGSFPTNFTDISPVLTLSGSGDAATNYLDVGGATNPAGRFYRVNVSP